MAESTVTIKVVADTSEFETSLRRARTELDQFNRHRMGGRWWNHPRFSVVGLAVHVWAAVGLLELVRWLT